MGQKFYIFSPKSRKPVQKKFDQKRKTAQRLSLRTLFPNPIRRDKRKLFQKKFDQKPIATAGSSDATLAVQRI